MAGITESPVFESEIYRIEVDDPVIGGEPNPTNGGGLSNIPHLQLANRTQWLRDTLLARYTNGQIDTAIAAAMSVLTANEILNRVKTVDGAGSALDADLLDGLHYSAFWRYSDAPGSIATNGYQIFPSGLMLQWGVRTSGSSLSVVFPTAFPVDCYNVQLTGSDASTVEIFTVNARSRTGFSMVTDDTARSCYYSAVGR
jgi:hypothetical protein